MEPQSWVIRHYGLGCGHGKRSSVRKLLSTPSIACPNTGKAPCAADR
jgi:hypothetical protein